MARLAANPARHAGQRQLSNLALTISACQVSSFTSVHQHESSLAPQPNSLPHELHIDVSSTPGSIASNYVKPFLAAATTKSTKRSNSASDVYTFGVTRIPLINGSRSPPDMCWTNTLLCDQRCFCSFSESTPEMSNTPNPQLASSL